jgi:hypothetical protein
VIGTDWRRGFVDTLQLPAQVFVQHGEQLRERYPLLRKLVLYRLNGWGARLAQCECLRGIRELDLPCWYPDDDARALASSPHLGAVERVVCWAGDSHEQGRIFASGSAWPGLRNLHLGTSGRVRRPCHYRGPDPASRSCPPGSFHRSIRSIRFMKRKTGGCETNETNPVELPGGEKNPRGPLPAAAARL